MVLRMYIHTYTYVCTSAEQWSARRNLIEKEDIP